MAFLNNGHPLMYSTILPYEKPGKKNRLLIIMYYYYYVYYIAIDVYILLSERMDPSHLIIEYERIVSVLILMWEPWTY